MAIRITGIQKNYLVIYAPTEDHPEEETKAFYESLQDCVRKKQFNDVIIPIGDFNAIVVQGRDQDIGGEFSLGLRNNNGQHLINFCI